MPDRVWSLGRAEADAGRRVLFLAEGGGVDLLDKPDEWAVTTDESTLADFTDEDLPTPATYSFGSEVERDWWLKERGWLDSSYRYLRRDMSVYIKAPMWRAQLRLDQRRNEAVESGYREPANPVSLPAYVSTRYSGSRPIFLFSWNDKPFMLTPSQPASVLRRLRLSGGLRDITDDGPHPGYERFVQDIAEVAYDCAAELLQWFPEDRYQRRRFLNEDVHHAMNSTYWPNPPAVRQPKCVPRVPPD